jgi:hypothetical protein
VSCLLGVLEGGLESTSINLFEVVLSTLSHPCTISFVSVALCDFPLFSFISALLDENFGSILFSNDRFLANVSEENVLLAWADLESLVVFLDFFAEVFIDSIDLLSLPLLGILSNAGPHDDVIVISVLLVLHRDASLALLVLESSSVENENLRNITLFIWSSNQNVSLLK